MKLSILRKLLISLHIAFWLFSAIIPLICSLSLLYYGAFYAMPISAPSALLSPLCLR